MRLQVSKEKIIQANKSKKELWQPSLYEHKIYLVRFHPLPILNVLLTSPVSGSQ